MKSLLIIALLLLFTFAVNAEVSTNAVRTTAAPVQQSNKQACVPINCLRRGPKVKIILKKSCKTVRVGSCKTRTRCCKSVKRCLFKTFCKAKKKKCSWASKVKTSKKCLQRRKRRIVRRRKVVRRRRVNRRRRVVRRRKVVKRRVVRRRKVVKRRVVRRRKTERLQSQVVCTLYADPHVQGFNRKYYEAQTPGDWVLYRGESLAAHYRGKSFGRWVGPIKFGIRLYHHRIFTNGFTFNNLLIDGKLKAIPNGKTDLKRGSIIKNGNKVTFTTNDGEEIDLVTFGTFFNAYVRTKVVKVSGICAHKFVRSRFFNHPQVKKIKPFILPKCPRKKHFAKKCAKLGLKGQAKKECVIDRCLGFSKKLEKKIIKINKEEKKVVVKVDNKKVKWHRVHRIVCSLYADPHVHGFNKKYFEAQSVGDWVLYKGRRLSAHYRGKSFGRWVGPIKFGFRLYKNKIYTTGFKFDTLLINGKVRKLPNGVLKLKRGGLIKRNGNKITISTNKGEEVDLVTFGWFFNAYVRSSEPNIHGICSQQFKTSKFFKHPVKGKIVKVVKKKCNNRRQFELKCKVKGLKGKTLKFCVRDLCNGLPVRIEKEILKENKKEEKVKIVKVDKRVQRITCELYADPHVKGYNKKYYEAQTTGDWVLYRGRNLSVHYRGKSFGRWVGPIKFGVRLYHHRIYSVAFTFDKLKIDGEVRTIPNGKTDLKRGSIVRNGNKITFSTNDGEEVDFITYAWFFNGYVRSNIPNIEGICSQQFIRSRFFNHPVKGQLEVIKKETCGKKEEYTKRCQNKGLTGDALKFCVRDLCNGLPEKVEKQILKDNKKEEKKKVVIKRVNRIDCLLYADPHARGFNGRHFEAQVEGDWLLYKGLNLKLYYRGQRFGGWVGQVKWAAVVYGVRVESNGFSAGSVVIDGRQVSVNGKKNLKNGGFLNVVGNKITISTNDGEEADFVSFGSFFNAFVRSNVPDVSGICSQQFTKTKFFNHPQTGHVDQIKVKGCAKKAKYEEQCKKRGLSGAELKDCVFDRCQGLSKKVEKKIIKLVKKERKIRLTPKPQPPKHNPWRPRPVEQPRVVVRVPPRTPSNPPRRVVQPPRRVVRPAPRVFFRRGRGDVWLSTKSGKWVDVNDLGTYKYLEDNKIGLKVGVQFTKRGRGTVVSAVSFEYKNNVVVAESDGTVQLNGETVDRDGAVFNFKNKKVKVRGFKSGEFEFRGLGRERITIKYEEETRSYEVAVGTLAAHHTGLYADPEHPQKYQMSKTESKFDRYVKFKVVKPPTPTPKQLKFAKECCKKLNGLKKAQCESDSIRTGKCLHYYLEEEPELD